MTTLLPKDADNNVIPALRLRDGGAHTLSVTTASAQSNTLAFDVDTKIISLYSTVPVYIKFSDNAAGATTSDHFFPANIYYDIAISGGGHKGVHYSFISALASDTDGTLYISEKQ